MIKKITRQLRDSLAYWRVFSRPESERYYQVTKLGSENETLLAEAKRLHAAVYLSKSFINHEDTLEGIIHELSDPHQKHADYFVVKRKNTVVGLARQIIYKGKGPHHESFPVLEKAMIYNRSLKRIMSFHPHEIVEISALVKKGGESSVVPLLLYRAMWRHSVKENHQLWVMACDVRLYQRLKLLYGPALTRIGKRTHYQGGDVIPVALHIPRGMAYMGILMSSRRKGIFDIQRNAVKFITGRQPTKSDLPRGL